MTTRRIFGLLTAMAAMTMTLVACIKDPIDEMKDTIIIGSTIPDFTVKLNNGESISAAELREQVSVIVFFHTECSDCQQVLPSIEQLYHKYHEQGVAFALISRAETAPSIEEFWDKHNMSIPYSPQEDRVIYELFAKIRVPRVYVSSAEGTIQHIFTDDPLPTLEQIEMAIQRQL